MPKQIEKSLLVWGDDVIDENTYDQARNALKLPFLAGHMALMPDAHFGYGVPVGSVIPTKGAIVPYAVGVDIGCGMAALKLSINASHLPDSIDGLMGGIAKSIPAGNGKAQTNWKSDVHLVKEMGSLWPGTPVTSKLQNTAISQCGTLGGGNHFFEVCLDENDDVWIVLHSGSRGIGNQLAQVHIKTAKGLMAQWFIELDDPNLAYLVQDTLEFDAYIADMLWAQDYARLNRDTMLNNGFSAFYDFMWRYGIDVTISESINCHHNFTQMENHHGKNMWITRKGAIKAGMGDLGIIPGSMGAKSFIVEGLGNPASYNSCSHGAGRKHGRNQAKQLFNQADLAQQMEGRVWNSDRAESLVDEIPSAYKDIDQVMEAQKDLVSIKHTLRQIFNYKG